MLEDGIVLGNTLESRQAYGRIGGSQEPLDRHRKEENPKLPRKGDRGMTVKPMSWVLAVLNTSKGVKALEDDQTH